MPKVEIIIGNQVSEVDSSELERELDRRRHDLLKGLQTFLREYASKDLPAMADKQIIKAIAEYRNGYVGEVDAIEGPANARKLILGIEPAEVALRDGTLVVNLSTSVEDPTRSSQPLPSQAWWSPSANPGQAPLPKVASNLNADAAVAVSTETVNRMLQLSFLRGYFRSIDIGDGETLRAMNAPTFRMDGSKGVNKAILMMDVENDVKGFTAGTVKNGTIRFRFNLVIRVESTSSGVRLIKESIDLSSLWVDPASINWWGSKVRSSVQDRLTKASNQMRKTIDVLADMPLPKDLMGIPLKVSSVRATEHFLTLFLSFGKL